MWIIIYNIPPWLVPRKHIISPSPALSEERPLALVAWGCRLLMAEVEPDKVKQFIRRRGLKGPEVTILIKYQDDRSEVTAAVLQGTMSKEGQYRHGLLQLARPPPGSDSEDSNLCPERGSGNKALGWWPGR